MAAPSLRLATSSWSSGPISREQVFELRRETHDYSDRSIASALVLNGEGFWASTMRGLATSLQLIGSRQRQLKLRVCATTEEAAAWLPAVHNQKSHHPVQAAELRAALSNLCSRTGGMPHARTQP
jgi:hypothetical protein